MVRVAESEEVESGSQLGWRRRHARWAEGATWGGAASARNQAPRSALELGREPLWSRVGCGGFAVILAWSLHLD
jgi:hypothetical protein